MIARTLGVIDETKASTSGEHEAPARQQAPPTIVVNDAESSSDSLIALAASTPLPAPELGALGVDPLADVVRRTRPRYHFAAGGGRPARFWEREPFVWDDADGGGRVSRFVSLGAFGGEQAAGKKPRVSAFGTFFCAGRAAAGAERRLGGLPLFSGSTRSRSPRTRPTRRHRPARPTRRETRSRSTCRRNGQSTRRERTSAGAPAGGRRTSGRGSVSRVTLFVCVRSLEGG